MTNIIKIADALPNFELAPCVFYNSNSNQYFETLTEILKIQTDIHTYIVPVKS